MPDSNGRYTLLEMRQYVLRNLASLRATAVDSTTGAESTPLILGENAQFSRENLNLRINSSALKTSLLINPENETLFAAEVFYDMNVGQLQYALPPNLDQIRGLWWKPASVNAPADPKDYVFMSYQDGLNGASTITGDFPGQVGRPTWRRVGSYIQLNQDPGDFQNGNSVQGLWFRYIKYVTFLSLDSDILDIAQVRVAQEVVVWDATLDLVRSQDEVVDSAGVEKTLAYWNQLLEIDVRGAYRPPEIRLIGPTYVKNTFSGRR